MTEMTEKQFWFLAGNNKSASVLAARDVLVKKSTVETAAIMNSVSERTVQNYCSKFEGRYWEAARLFKNSLIY